MGDTERLGVMELLLRLKRFPSPAGVEPGTLKGLLVGKEELYRIVDS